MDDYFRDTAFTADQQPRHLETYILRKLALYLPQNAPSLLVILLPFIIKLPIRVREGLGGPINQADWECQEVAALSSQRLRLLQTSFTDTACLASIIIRAMSLLISPLKIRPDVTQTLKGTDYVVTKGV